MIKKFFILLFIFNSSEQDLETYISESVKDFQVSGEFVYSYDFDTINI